MFPLPSVKQPQDNKYVKRETGKKVSSSSTRTGGIVIAQERPVRVAEADLVARARQRVPRLHPLRAPHRVALALLLDLVAGLEAPRHVAGGPGRAALRDARVVGVGVVEGPVHSRGL